jgi:hypothetical protein
MSELVVTQLPDYEALFYGATTQTAIGEASTNYLYYAHCAERIKHYLPDVMLIAVLRDPAERAYSAFVHRRRDGREPCASFDEALRLEEQRIHEHWSPLAHYRAGGFYYDKLKHYFELFDREQIRVFLYDDIQKDLSQVLRSIFAFLQVNEHFVPDTGREHNVSLVPRNKVMAASLHLARQSLAIAPVKRLFPQTLRERVKSKMLKKPQALAPEIRARLIEDYRNDILQLQDLIGRDLSAWLV